MSLLAGTAMCTALPSSPSDEASLLLRVTELANRFASRLVEPQDVDDLVQQIVLDCLVRLRTDRWRVRTSLRGVVRSMVRRRWIRNMINAKCRGAADARHLANQNDYEPEWMDSDMMLELSEAETVRAQALAELPERCCTAYLLVREEKATYRDVAAGLGISIGLVANYVKNAERHLTARVLGRRTLSLSSLRSNHRSPDGRRSVAGEAPRRRVVRAGDGGETATTVRATVTSARTRQIFAEMTPNGERTTANVDETTATVEQASPNFG